MTKDQLIDNLMSSRTLDLSVVIQDTPDIKIEARFLGLTFDVNSTVAMKLEITTIAKNVTINNQGTVVPKEPIVQTQIIRADESTQIPVVDTNGDPIIDTDTGLPITIGEGLYWKYLAWENQLPASFKTLLEQVIRIKYNLLPNTTKLVYSL